VAPKHTNDPLTENKLALTSMGSTNDQQMIGGSKPIS